MLRPDESHSLGSLAANAIRSETCSPWTSITRKTEPFLSIIPAPLCGSMRVRTATALVSEVDWTLPVRADISARILSRFAVQAIVCQHRVARSVQLSIALADGIANAIESPLLTKSFKLKVIVEHERGPGKPSGPAWVRRR